MRVGSFRRMEDHVHAKTRIVREEDDVKKQIIKDEKEARAGMFPFRFLIRIVMPVLEVRVWAWNQHTYLDNRTLFHMSF